MAMYLCNWLYEGLEIWLYTWGSFSLLVSSIVWIVVPAIVSMNILNPIPPRLLWWRFFVLSCCEILWCFCSSLMYDIVVVCCYDCLECYLVVLWLGIMVTALCVILLCNLVVWCIILFYWHMVMVWSIILLCNVVGKPAAPGWPLLPTIQLSTQRDT